MLSLFEFADPVGFPSSLQGYSRGARGLSLFFGSRSSFIPRSWWTHDRSGLRLHLLADSSAPRLGLVILAVFPNPRRYSAPASAPPPPWPPARVSAAAAKGLRPRTARLAAATRTQRSQIGPWWVTPPRWLISPLSYRLGTSPV